MPRVLEFTFHRKDRVSHKEFTNFFPHPLDFANTQNPPLYLPGNWFGSASFSVNKIIAGSKGIIHIGAKTGQEAATYAKYVDKVLWIEPVPEVFETLLSNIESYQGQIAIRALVSSSSGETRQLTISNNTNSSSVYELVEYEDVWPGVDYVKSMDMQTITLVDLLHTHNINSEDYDILCMNTQGSELDILKGAGSILKQFTYIVGVVPTFNAYEGGCQLAEYNDYLQGFGFRECMRRYFGAKNDSSCYMDIAYQNNNFIM